MFEKDALDRFNDTMSYLRGLLGDEAYAHLNNRWPAAHTTEGMQARQRLGMRLSLGGRSVFHGSEETALRKSHRAFLLVRLLVTNDTDAEARARLGSALMTSAYAADNQTRGVWSSYNQTVDSESLLQRTRALSKDPLRFLKELPVLPCDGNIATKDTADYSLIRMPNGDRATKLLLTPKLSNEYTNLLTYAPRTRQSDGIDVYFLPWASGRLTCMTIPTGGPDLFFTAAINGCSVFVEGPADNPTVYHGGITATWPAMDGSVPATVHAAKVANDIPLTWRELFWAKSPITHSASDPFAEVNKTHYIKDNTVDALGRETTARALAFQRSLEEVCGGLSSPITIITFVPWGTLFGIRTGVNWRFYLQENCSIIYSGRPMPGELEWRFGTSRLIRLSEVSATGHTVIHTSSIRPLTLVQSTTVYRLP